MVKVTCYICSNIVLNEMIYLANDKLSKKRKLQTFDLTSVSAHFKVKPYHDERCDCTAENFVLTILMCHSCQSFAMLMYTV